MSQKIKRKTIFRDAIHGITKPAITRLARKAGVKRIAGLVYQEVRGILKIRLEDVVKNALVVKNNQKRVTLSEYDVRDSLSLTGINVLFYRTKKTEREITLNTYINRVLKQVHPNAGLKNATRNQISQLMILLAKKITVMAKDLTVGAGRKVLSYSDITGAVNLVIPGMLYKHAISEGTKAIQKVADKKVNVQKSSGLTFSIARTRGLIAGKYRKKQTQSLGLQISRKASVFLTAVLEYICAEILELSGNTAKDYNRTLINSRHMFIAISNDFELKKLVFGVLGCVIDQGGVEPFIHTLLLAKTKTKKKTTKKKTVKKETVKKETTKIELSAGVAKPHRFRPGTVALREIRREQKLTKHTIPFAPFDRLCRKIIEDFEDKFSLSPIAVEILRSYSEYYLVDLLRDSLNIAIRCGKKSISRIDLNLARLIRGEQG